jgi:hypothetical protein
MKFLRLATLALVISSLALVSCGGGEEAAAPAETAPTAMEPPAEEDDHGHAHDEESLGTAQIGDLTVELAQGHGAITAGH